jgi:Flp pilus assembly protein TadB
MGRSAFLSVLSLVLGLGVALVVGSFLGWSTNPDKSAAFAAAHLEMARSGVSGSLEELQKRQFELAQKQPGFNSPDPHATVAILKTHPLLLGVFSLLFLCVFRPSWLWTAIVFVPVAVAAYFLVAPTAAIGVLAAAVLSIIWSFTYARLRRKVAP